MDPEAYSWFQSVDCDHSGYISIKELKQALVNSNWSSFNDETCLMMISEYGPSSCAQARAEPREVTVGGWAAVLRRNLLAREDFRQETGFKMSSLGLRVLSLTSFFKC